MQSSQDSSSKKKLPLIAVAVVLLAVFPKLVTLILRVPYPVHSKGAVIISGTSSGIGRATCGWLASRYPEVTLYCGVRQEKDATGFPFDQDNVQSVLLDITNQTQVDIVVEQIDQPLIGVINNAGITDSQTLEFLSEKRLRQMLEVNFYGGFRLTQAALPKLRAAKGRIVFVTSVSALMPGQSLFGAYQSSKCAAEAMGNAWRMELFPHQVSVSMVEPGFVGTNMVDAEIAKMKASLESPELTEEATLYPDLFGDDYLKLAMQIWEATGPMEETCEAMEDALFSLYPKTRYYTSRVGPMPAWMAVRLFEVLPDRAVDSMMRDVYPMVLILQIRSFVESLLGYT